MRTLLVLSILCGSTAALARQFTDANDPALAQTSTIDFNTRPAVPDPILSFQATAGGITVTVTTPPTTENLYSAQPDGAISSWQGFGPVTLTFDRPPAIVGLTQETCTNPITATFTGSTGMETITLPCSAGNHFLGADQIGDISQVVLSSSARWDDLKLGLGGNPSPSPSPADLRALLQTSVAKILPNNKYTLSLSAVDDGPGTTQNGTLMWLTQGLSASPAGSTSGPGWVQWSLPDLSSGQSTQVYSVELLTPPRGEFDCEFGINHFAIAQSTTRDPLPSNNLAVRRLTLDPAARGPQVCAPGYTIDDDCNGSSGCWDIACEFAAGCSIAWPDLGNNVVLDDWWPPLILPIDGPYPVPMWNPMQNQPENPPCKLPINGVLTDAPPYCCTSLIPVSEEVRWRDCHALDPNAIESDPPTSSLGFGTTQAGQTIHFTVHYENIGGADAHDVRVFLPLDRRFDESTLVVADGGSYDAATRFILWGDPVVFPHDPRVVHFTVTVRGDVQKGDHLRSQATVVFPDAFPPSSMDTNFLEHVVPNPKVPLVPDLAIFKCDPVGDGTYHVRLTNRGFGFAFDATAKIVDAPASIEVIDGEARFANPLDVNPDVLATVTPISTTLSLDTIELHGPAGADPCESLKWELHWTTPDGKPATATVQAAVDQDGDGIADYHQRASVSPSPAPGISGSAGCSCDLAGGRESSASGLALSLTLLALALRRRRARR